MTVMALHEVVFPEPTVVDTVTAADFAALEAVMTERGQDYVRLHYDGTSPADKELAGPWETLLAPFIGPVATYEATECHNPEPELLVMAQQAVVLPTEPQLKFASEWHCDSHTYLCAATLLTEFAVGTTSVAGEYQGLSPGEVLLQYGVQTEADNNLPPGLKVHQPHPLEIVVFDRSHPHRSTRNMTQESILRTLVQIMTRNVRFF